MSEIPVADDLQAQLFAAIDDPAGAPGALVRFMHDNFGALIDINAIDFAALLHPDLEIVVHELDRLTGTSVLRIPNVGRAKLLDLAAALLARKWRTAKPRPAPHVDLAVHPVWVALDKLKAVDPRALGDVVAAQCVVDHELGSLFGISVTRLDHIDFKALCGLPSVHADELIRLARLSAIAPRLMEFEVGFRRRANFVAYFAALLRDTPDQGVLPPPIKLPASPTHSRF